MRLAWLSCLPLLCQAFIKVPDLDDLLASSDFTGDNQISPSYTFQNPVPVLPLPAGTSRPDTIPCSLLTPSSFFRPLGSRASSFRPQFLEHLAGPNLCARGVRSQFQRVIFRGSQGRKTQGCLVLRDRGTECCPTLRQYSGVVLSENVVELMPGTRPTNLRGLAASATLPRTTEQSLRFLLSCPSWT